MYFRIVCECLGRDRADLVEEGGGGKGKDRPPLFLVDSSESSQYCQHFVNCLLSKQHFLKDGVYVEVNCMIPDIF